MVTSRLPHVRHGRGARKALSIGEPKRAARPNMIRRIMSISLRILP
jgi:hypothetical protein